MGAHQFCIRDIMIDTDVDEIQTPQGTVKLSPKEAVILEYFLTNPHQITSSEQLADFASNGRVLSPQRAETYVNTIRHKLGHHAEFIETIIGVGYRTSSNYSIKQAGKK